jgi:hypothetical protein
MLFRETVAVYFENSTEHKDKLCAQNAEFTVLKLVVHRVTMEFKRLIVLSYHAGNQEN